MTDQRLGIHAAQFFFTHRESYDWNVFGLQASVAEFFVERHIGVTVDGGYNGCFATGRELLDVSHDGLVVRVTERCVLLVDIRLFHTLALQISAQDFVGRTWVHIVGTEQYPTLGSAAVFAHQIVNRWNRLLVRCCTCVEHVFAELFTFVLHGVEQ